MNQLFIKKPYDSFDPSLKEGFLDAVSKATMNQIDIVVTTLENACLLNFLGIKVKETLQKKRECVYSGVKLKLYTCTTVKSLYSSECLLVLCVPDNFTKKLDGIEFENCIIVPRHERNVECWQNYQGAQCV